MRLFGIYGAGGFGREIRWPLEQSLISDSPAEDWRIVFVDDYKGIQGTTINGTKVISFEEFLKSETKVVSVSYADPHRRRDLVEKCTINGIDTHSIRSPTARIWPDVTIGEGAIICDNSIITCNVSIGKHFHCNLFSFIEHDCIIGDYVTLSPRVSVNGRVVVEDFVFVGTGAVIRPGNLEKPLTIGKGAIVGMGAVVTKDVAPGDTVIGNPARSMNSS